MTMMMKFSCSRKNIVKVILQLLGERRIALLVAYMTFGLVLAV